jgi:hypothetical protein
MGSNPVGTTIDPLCEPRRDAKGSSYVKSPIAPFRTRIVRKKARFHVLRTSGLALQ